MAGAPKDSLIEWIGKLCGQDPRPCAYMAGSGVLDAFPKGGIGHSQFNELLLSLLLDRTSYDFFAYLFGAPSVATFEDFKTRITLFRLLAILHYGNIKFAFKRLSVMSNDEIRFELGRRDPKEILEEYKARHEPLIGIRSIVPAETYYLGYIIDQQLKAQKAELAAAGKSTSQIDALESRCRALREIGEFNHHCYLDYDHMDVYVATSMRERHDFWNVNRFVREVFDRSEIKELKLRHFDPTQAYCAHRIDKGLSEALMLKRARCAIYMAGEVDTLGKDSELAATLAQGKPVIAYVPELKDYDRFKNEYVSPLLKELYPNEDPLNVVKAFLRVYAPEAAWEQRDIRDWIDDKTRPDFDSALRLVFENAKRLYDKRAQTLRETHPLGLQVNLQTGVANGVLVARDAETCARLLRGLLLNELTFELDEKSDAGAILIREQTTHSVYRVLTRDEHLINSFWNFYLRRT